MSPHDIEELFQGQPKSISLHQKSNNAEYNYLILDVNAKEVTIKTSPEMISNYQNSVFKGILFGTLVSPLLTLVIAYLRSLYRSTDLVLIGFSMIIAITAMGIGMIIFYFAIKYEQKSYEEKILLEIRKKETLVEISGRVSENQLSKDILFKNLRIGVPVNQIEQELQISSVSSEIFNNLDKLTQFQRIVFGITNKLVRYPPSLTVDLSSEYVRIIDKPLISDKIGEFMSQSFLIFGFHDVKIIDQFRKSIIQWSNL